MPVQFKVLKDNRSHPLFNIQFSDDTYRIKLPADTIKTVTVPAGCNIAFFAYSTATVFVGTETFTLPGATFASGPVELSPSALEVTPAGTLYLQSELETWVSIKFGEAQ